MNRLSARARPIGCAAPARRRFVFQSFFGALALVVGRGWAAGLPPQKLVLFLLRVLAYDRNLKNRAKTGTVHIVFVFAENDRWSKDSIAGLMDALNAISQSTLVAHMPVRASQVAMREVAQVEKTLQENGSVALFVGPNFNAAALGALSALARRLSILTFTDTEAFVKQGLSIAFIARGEKPTIVINPRSAKAEGADLASNLLHLAEIVNSDR